jgi:hypothetical protein
MTGFKTPLLATWEAAGEARRCRWPATNTNAASAQKREADFLLDGRDQDLWNGASMKSLHPRVKQFLSFSHRMPELFPTEKCIAIVSDSIYKIP